MVKTFITNENYFKRLMTEVQVCMCVDVERFAISQILELENTY